MSHKEEQLEKLLDSTIGHHGYWLKNHSEIIKEDLLDGIEKVGLRSMMTRLEDYRSPYVKNLYKKIKVGKL